MGEKPGTRVFKKSSPNCKLTVYLGKRDFVDHLDKVDPVDGVVLVDPDYLKDRKVFVTLTCAFRYGREDLDVLGLSFRKDLFIANYQAFPPAPNPPRPPTRLQDRLLRKLGPHAHPFFFTIPQNLPCSVTLQPGPEDTGKACGVDFEIRAFCAKSLEEKSHKRNSVRLVIRKVQFAPEKPGPQPSAETTRHFLMSDRSLHLEASLDKELYYHGEPLNVNVHVTNNSTKTIKKIKVSVTRCPPVPRSARCILSPRCSATTGRSGVWPWMGSSSTRTPTWLPAPCERGGGGAPMAQAHALLQALSQAPGALGAQKGPENPEGEDRQINGEMYHPSSDERGEGARQRRQGRVRVGGMCAL
ncbi:beta-arrestin-2 isoform X3 [Mustela erminea]|uniref:beta-arrestin-2 isoform X3 n=1 Tax=Mustela erminea TaxID=36723 RepID=UPI001386FC9A|nr:beta-arrestin-2 isoform X3 [Mustela erminea]